MIGVVLAMSLKLVYRDLVGIQHLKIHPATFLTLASQSWVMVVQSQGTALLGSPQGGLLQKWRSG
jgi:hypothetical protein